MWRDGVNRWVNWLCWVVAFNPHKWEEDIFAINSKQIHDYVVCDYELKHLWLVTKNLVIKARI